MVSEPVAKTIWYRKSLGSSLGKLNLLYFPLAHYVTLEQKCNLDQSWSIRLAQWRLASTLLKTYRTKNSHFPVLWSLSSAKTTIPKDWDICALHPPVLGLNYDIGCVDTSSNEHSPHILIFSHNMFNSCLWFSNAWNGLIPVSVWSRKTNRSLEEYLTCVFSEYPPFPEFAQTRFLTEFLNLNRVGFFNLSLPMCSIWLDELTLDTLYPLYLYLGTVSETTSCLFFTGASLGRVQIFQPLKMSWVMLDEYAWQGARAAFIWMGGRYF